MTQDTLPNKVLIVDADAAFCTAVEQGLAKFKVNVIKANNFDTALYMFNQNRVDVCLVELEFGEIGGLSLVQKWRKHENVDRRFTGFIAMSTQKRTAAEENLIKELGDIDLVMKPFQAINILTPLTRALSAKQRSLEYHHLKDRVLDHYAKSGNFEKAAELLLQNIVQLGFMGQQTLLELYEKGNKLEEALAVVDKLLQEKSNDITLVNSKARILMKLKRFAEASACFEKADQIAPQNIDRIKEMADTYMNMKDIDKSLKKYEQYFKLSPEDSDAKFNVMSKLYEMGEDDKARQFARKHATPMEIVRYYNNKGVMLSKQSKVDEAIAEYTKALEFYPKFKENYRIHYNIALAYIGKKTRRYLEKALVELKKCLELEPTYDKAKHSKETVEKALAGAGTKSPSKAS